MFPNVVSVTCHWLGGLFDGSYVVQGTLDRMSLGMV